MPSRPRLQSLRGVSVVAALAVAAGCVAKAKPLPSADMPPAAPREFRAAWVATVENIDWPSKKGLTSADQQKELIAILDRSVALKLNCLIVQIRTSADALYPSRYEPWSVYLSGKQGVPPNPVYDPLKMWVEEGHKRGIEIHAWFNPYRARAGSPKFTLADSHAANRRPDIVKSYGTYLWLDPGEPDAAKQSLAVFNDVVRRYDVDGIHIDDYFYPYPVKVSWKEDAKNPDPDETEKKARADRPELPFPDDESWAKYKKKHPVQPNPTTAPADVDRVAREDWRRQNVSELVHDIYTSTKKIKPYVKFGISPFGIGRKGAVPDIVGFDQYEKLYADAPMWLEKGWCDYFVPQLYWPIEKKEQAFAALYDYWRAENKMDRHIWPGLYTSKMLDKPSTKPSTQPNYWNSDQLVRQIEVVRSRNDDPGVVHFSMKALMKDAGGLPTKLSAATYATDALVPASPWLDNKAPPKPSAKIVRDEKGTRVDLKPGSGEATWLYAIWSRTADGWKFHSAPGSWRTVEIPADTSAVVVTAVDRCGNESERVESAIR